MEYQEIINEYNCAEYFNSALLKSGYYDELEQVMVIEPIDQIEEHIDLGFLQIGRPGVDGIGFGYRKGQKGIWAYYPLENEFILICPTLDEFLEKWKTNQITL